MYVRDINPHLRFATAMRYEIGYNHRTVKVADCRIFYVTEGSAQLRIANNEYTLMPDSLFYCNAGSIYSVHTQTGFSLLCLNFDLSQRYHHIAQPIPVSNATSIVSLTENHDEITDSNFLTEHLFMENAVHLRTQLEQIVDTYCCIDLYAKEAAGAKLKLFLLEMHSAYPGSTQEKLTLVKEYIQQNYAKRITNKDLADLVNYHEYHLNRAFKQHIGINLHEYLLKVRLNNANHLILNSKLSLQEIADAVGFGSYAHFSVAFKQLYGLSPLQYRKQIKQRI